MDIAWTTREELLAHNQELADTVPGQQGKSLERTQPIVFRLVDQQRSELVLLCTNGSGVVSWTMWNNAQLPVAITALGVMSEMGDQPVLAGLGWQRAVAQWVVKGNYWIRRIERGDD